MPRLRLPECKNQGGWRLTTLGDVLEEHGFKSDGTAEVHSVSLSKGIVPQIEHLGRSFAASDTGHYGLVRPFDVVYTRSPLAEFKLGIVKQHKSDHNVIVSPLYGVFEPRNRCIGLLVAAFFESSARAFRYLDPLAQKGAKNTIQLSNERFLSGSLYLPEGEDEQRRVAEFLGSLDDLIAAEGRKLEALRQHKQGLMQQLFPLPGATRPRLRFPEFQHAGDWEEKRLGDLGTLISGLTYKPTDVQDDGLLVLRSSNIQNGEITLDDCVYVRRDVNGANLTQPGDILICVRNGSRTLIGKNAIVPKGMPACTHGAFMTVFRSSSPHFVHVVLQTTSYVQQVAANLGATINSINGSQLLKYRFIVPKPAEQQQIAALFSSLDDVLAAQSRRVDALKAHKQGLLQQVFPPVEDQ